MKTITLEFNEGGVLFHLLLQTSMTCRLLVLREEDESDEGSVSREWDTNILFPITCVNVCEKG